MSQPPAPARHHHLDAVRAFAMLLGIGLHAALSLAPGFWLVRDRARSESLGYFFEAVHGFRMQLFFLVSGFFTMMLWRRRGLSSMLEQRFQRVLIPCVLGVCTILPLMTFVTTWAGDRLRKSPTPASQPAADKPAARAAQESPLVTAVRAGDREQVKELLARGEDVNQPDPKTGMPPLGWATLRGELPLVQQLLDARANPNATDREGYAPLHQAAFMGRQDVIPLLLAAGADPTTRSKKGETPEAVTQTDWLTTRYIAGDLGVRLEGQDALNAGREKAVQLLQEAVQDRAAATPTLTQRLTQWRADYLAFLTSEAWNLRVNPTPPALHLILSPQFSHLWFLWFLCWLVLLFALLASVASLLRLPRLPAVLTLSWARWLWVIPLTLVPQAFMGVLFGTFGPDTALGLVPPPHLLTYYAVFFLVGAMLHDADDATGRFGRWWWLAFAVAAATFLTCRSYPRESHLLINTGLQTLFTWSMIVGFIGLFRRLLPGESRVIRYLSDSAYWLYLVHLPLVIYLQEVVRLWEWPALAKFAFICGVTTLSLLVSYQLLVRNTYLGVLLSGRRASRPVA